MITIILGIVDELKSLEAGRMFQLRSMDNGDLKETFIKVFLLSSCCDKPAQCIVQCLPEPIGHYGCGRCEIRGTISFILR
jgi:hypothetical protein